MSKKRPLNEGIILDLIDAVKKAAAAYVDRETRKMMDRDPQLKAIIQKQVALKDDLERWSEEYAKQDPDFARYYSVLKNTGH